MTTSRWGDVRDIQDYYLEPSGDEEVVLVTVIGPRLAQVRRARGMTQRQVAQRMGVTKGRISQIEQGKVSGHDVIARYARALGGRLHQTIYFNDGDIASIA